MALATTLAALKVEIQVQEERRAAQLLKHKDRLLKELGDNNPESEAIAALYKKYSAQVAALAVEMGS